jgi:hypothetical protein
MSLILIVVVLILLFGGGGFYGHRQGITGEAASEESWDCW